MKRRLFTTTLLGICLAAPLASAAPKRFEWSTKSAEAKSLLVELQQRIERFQAVGPETVAFAQKLEAADPEFAMGIYYLSAVTPAPDNQKHLDRAALLAKKASDGERRFIEAMVVTRANQGANFRDGIPHLEKLQADYPDERLVRVILGQLYQGDGKARQAHDAFEAAQRIGPTSPRVQSFLANDDLIAGNYGKAREKFEAVEKELPKGSVPFVIRYGVAFSHLYEGKVDAALASLETYLGEYRNSGAAQGFPEVFIWNSIARINLENGRLDAAMKAYEKGYESVPGSGLPEDQKQLWLGRLKHGRCRTLAKMGKTQEARALVADIKKMIDDAGEAGKQYLPAYHYLEGYVDLEAGDATAAVAALKQANAQDPFHTLLLGRAYEKLGDKENAKKAYQTVVESQQNGLERALAYPEARKKVSA